MALLVVLAAVCSIILSKVKMPPLIGFLLSGILLANFFSLSTDFREVIEVFSNLGLIMLMFAIGMEIDVRKIKNNGVFALTVAAIQLPLMVVGGFIAGTFLGFNMLQAIALGCIISGSSTAVVMAVLKAQGTLDSEHIEMLVLITIMEDIGQVVMLSMLTPALNGGQMETGELVNLILNIAFFMGICFFLGLRIVPRFINWVSAKISDELVSLLCVGLAFALAFAANAMGLSVAIGAFLMGVMVASTVKKEIVERFVEPLKSLFMAMFFISVGMEVTISGITQNIALILIIFLLFAFLKSSTVFLGYWVGNAEPRSGFISAVSLCAMGEFAFIIAKQALDCGVYDQSVYSSVIGAALVSMIVLPISTRYTGRFWDGMEARSPQCLRDWCTRRNEARNDFYAALNAIPGKGKRLFMNGLGRIYFSIILMCLVEVCVYFAYGPTRSWLDTTYGTLGRYWDLVLMFINFWLLFIPCKALVAEFRTVFYTYALGRKAAPQTKEKEDVDRIRFYEGMNPLLVAIGLDILIIIAFPTESDSIFTLINFIVAVVVVSLVRIYRLRKGTAKLVPLPSLEEDHEDAVESSE